MVMLIINYLTQVSSERTLTWQYNWQNYKRCYFIGRYNNI